MALDLSALEKAFHEPLTGKPLYLALQDIDEDPEQPRQTFSPDALQEMADSIRARGVKTPVSVRPHPKTPGRWILNYGARRYRGSLLANQQTIPAFVDELHDAYDQVIENVQREALTPMELALFIQKRLALGEKKAEIARNLGKSKAVITWHAALIELPDCLEALYASGKCRSAQYLYELRHLYQAYPTRVETWVQEVGEISRKTLTELTSYLKGNQNVPEFKTHKPRVGGDDFIPALKPRADESSLNAENWQAKLFKETKPLDKQPTLTGPVLRVSYEQCLARIVLDKRPSKSGWLLIQLEADQSFKEVPAKRCQLIELINKDG